MFEFGLVSDVNGIVDQHDSERPIEIDDVPWQICIAQCLADLPCS